jgi:REP element-mobilizing transposase RayT
MVLFKNKYSIESNRLKNWDYSSEAIYFITLVTQNRHCIFGTINEGKMILNANGEIIKNELSKSIVIRENWIFHNWIIMPNHVHLLIEIINNRVSTDGTHTDGTHAVETHGSASQTKQPPVIETHCSASLRKLELEIPPKLSRKPNSISSFVAIFKSVTTKQINVLNNNEGEIIWQSNYHDHIVRTYDSFENIDNYIKNNPKKWDADIFNHENHNL